MVFYVVVVAFLMTFIINKLCESCHGWLKLDEIHVVYWNKVWHVSHPNNSMLSRMIGIWMGNHLVSDKNCNIVIYNVHFIDLLRYDFTKNVMNTTNIVQIYVQIFRCWFVFVDYIEIIVLLHTWRSQMLNLWGIWLAKISSKLKYSLPSFSSTIHCHHIH